MDVLNEVLDNIQNKTPYDEPITISNDEIIAELIRNQRDRLINEKKLFHGDMKRIAKNINNSIFDKFYCTLWKGYITNFTKKDKGTYINFYFRTHKLALHRLLYYNYIGDLSTDDYLKFSCTHKGYCCNVNCLVKNRYNTHNSNNKSNPQKKKYDGGTMKDTKEIIKTVDENLFVYFD